MNTVRSALAAATLAVLVSSEALPARRPAPRAALPTGEPLILVGQANPGVNALVDLLRSTGAGDGLAQTACYMRDHTECDWFRLALADSGRAVTWPAHSVLVAHLTNGQNVPSTVVLAYEPSEQQRPTFLGNAAVTLEPGGYHREPVAHEGQVTALYVAFPKVLGVSLDRVLGIEVARAPVRSGQ